MLVLSTSSNFCIYSLLYEQLNYQIMYLLCWLSFSYIPTTPWLVSLSSTSQPAAYSSWTQQRHGLHQPHIMPWMPQTHCQTT